MPEECLERVTKNVYKILVSKNASLVNCAELRCTNEQPLASNTQPEIDNKEQTEPSFRGRELFRNVLYSYLTLRKLARIR